MSEKNTIHELSDMIGMVVKVSFLNEKEDAMFLIKCKISGYYFDDFYFYEKWMEPVYLIFQVEPLEELPSHIDPEELADISLDRIYKSAENL